MNTYHDISSRERFEYTLRHFIDTLQLLNVHPAEQVRCNGNYNTAYELLWDLAAGRAMIDEPACYLPPDVCESIGRLTGDLARLPFENQAGRQGDAEEHLSANLTDMLQPCWAPIRVQARELLDALTPAMLINQVYFDAH